VAAGVAAVGAALLSRGFRYSRRIDFDGRTVVITGGSRGLGLVLARELGQQGARLVIAARDDEELDRARRHLQSEGVDAITVACDVGERADAERLIAEAIERTGRKKLVLAGLWTEVCIAFPTVQALEDGYEVYVVEDACGDVSQLNHDNAMKRVIQAGAKPVTVLSTMLEWQRDWAHKETYDAVMDIVKNHMGAYGIGVEYAYTMVHGLPASKFAEYEVPSLVGAH